MFCAGESAAESSAARRQRDRQRPLRRRLQHGQRPRAERGRRRECKDQADGSRKPRSLSLSPCQRFCVCGCTGWAKNVRPQTRGHGNIMQGVVGFLVTTLLANLPKNLPVKKIGKRLRFYRIVDMSFVASLFWPTQYIFPVCQHCTISRNDYDKHLALQLYTRSRPPDYHVTERKIQRT